MKADLEKKRIECVIILEKYGWMNKIHEIQIYTCQSDCNYSIYSTILSVLKNYFYAVKSWLYIWETVICSNDIVEVTNL